MELHHLFWPCGLYSVISPSCLGWGLCVLAGGWCVCCVGVWKDPPWSSCSALDPTRATARPSSWLTLREVLHESDVNLAMHPVVYRRLKCYLLQFQECSVPRKRSSLGSSLNKAWPNSKHCLIHNRRLFVPLFLHGCAKLAGKNRLLKRAAVHLRIFAVWRIVQCTVEKEMFVDWNNLHCFFCLQVLKFLKICYHYKNDMYNHV